MCRKFHFTSLLISILPFCDGVTVNATLGADGQAQLLRSEKGLRRLEKEDLCSSGDLCIEHKCGDQIFDTVDCAATSDGLVACPGTQVCKNKSTTDAHGNLTARFRCCCPACT
mmetsp:Transcript_134212/g.189647  ORF Transcript_134212/g.189647 Transcript_134212/m.189647 type:complete len:113 (+) Transcript_134212:59-397(+)